MENLTVITMSSTTTTAWTFPQESQAYKTGFYLALTALAVFVVADVLEDFGYF